MNHLFNKIRNIKRKLVALPFPGSYSSPIVDVIDIRRREEEIFQSIPKLYRDVELNERKIN